MCLSEHPPALPASHEPVRTEGECPHGVRRCQLAGYSLVGGRQNSRPAALLEVPWEGVRGHWEVAARVPGTPRM